MTEQGYSVSLPAGHVRYTSIPIVNTPSELPVSGQYGMVRVVLEPLGLYIFTASGWTLVGAPSGAGIPPSTASEVAQGVVELATEAEVQAGTAGILVATVARLKAELDRRAALSPAWIAPTLLNGWVNLGGVEEVAGYRKTPWGEVQLRGSIKSGTTTNGTVLFTLPVGYRPAALRNFIVLEGDNTAARIFVNTAGNVTIQDVVDNSRLSLESVRFDV